MGSSADTCRMWAFTEGECCVEGKLSFCFYCSRKLVARRTQSDAPNSIALNCILASLSFDAAAAAQSVIRCCEHYIIENHAGYGSGRGPPRRMEADLRQCLHSRGLFMSFTRDLKSNFLSIMILEGRRVSSVHSREISYAKKQMKT